MHNRLLVDLNLHYVPGWHFHRNFMVCFTMSLVSSVMAFITCECSWKIRCSIQEISQKNLVQLAWRLRYPCITLQNFRSAIVITLILDSLDHAVNVVYMIKINPCIFHMFVIDNGGSVESCPFIWVLFDACVLWVESGC